MIITARTPTTLAAGSVVSDAVISKAAACAPGTLVSVTVEAPAIDPLALHAAAGPGATLWLGTDGVALVGIGEAWAARPAAGDGSRFAAVSEAWSALLADAVIEAGDAPRGSGPLLVGGFAFDDATPTAAPWQGFERAAMVLPALLVRASPGGTWLTLSWIVRDEASSRVVAGGLVRRWAEVVGRATRPAPDAPAPTLRLVASEPQAAAWRDSVSRLAGAVGRGRLDKAVLARRVTLAASAPIDVAAVLGRLRTAAPGATVFAIHRAGHTFLGATPERLVSLHGREFGTMAMAGSAHRSTDAATDAMLSRELLESDKEREEHGVVVAMLRHALAPVAERLEVAPRPEVVRLRHVQHLVTPVSGRLREDGDVLQLVERLHPTPAVGGMPRALALELIAEEEPFERGWYAAPIGWMDRHGDGDFAVALRSGVVAGREATLFAGCGIVADSDPEREWDESAAKLLALSSALGSVEP